MMAAIRSALTDELRPLDVIVSIVVLFVLAVAQPLLDLLGRNAEFFLARAAPAIDIVILAILLTVVVPLAIAGVVVGISTLHATTGRIVHYIVLTILAAVLVLQVIDIVFSSTIGGWWEIAIAVAVGMLIALAYFRFEGFRSAGRFAAIAPLVVIGLFLFTSSTSQLVFAAPAIAEAAEVNVGNPAPVVMVIFDEFPVASLMDGEGNLQENVYPNFARLASTSTWYRNAVTTQQQSEDAIPAILSGRKASGNQIPTAADHPFTLFTLLADDYDLNVHESVTSLCPEYACTNITRPQVPATQRWRTLVSDLRIVAGHLFLPTDMTRSLPSIDASWANFSRDEGSTDAMIARFQKATYDADRRDAIDRFTSSIEPQGAEPQLSFLHALVPHVPWEYLPSGQKFASGGVAPGTKSPGWGDDEWLVDQGYQRHLFMAEYADGVLGDILDELETTGEYDNALVVVVADHGVAVRPNIEHRREINDDTIGDIAAVPMFIKLPGQRDGEIDDYRASILDILPTMADALETDVPWATDGISLLDSNRPVRTESEISGTDGTFTFGVDGSEARAIARRRIDHFGTDGAFGLAPPGYAQLLGFDITDVGSDVDARVTLRNSSVYRDVDPSAPVVPTWVVGTVTLDSDLQREIVVAIGVNGRVEAVTRSFVSENGAIEIGAMIPPRSLVAGVNDIELVVVGESP
ncbi:MAG: sulfatase-like hydrolase/transferase [Actinomycetia bacterium]|nr:sulfatase-like hydrolase/transferase [Actinomycetes bacterium]